MSKDLFSKQAVDYSRYRPGYPQELIDYVCSFVTDKNQAWDCASGNGQAALLLAAQFKLVQATDLSEKQLLQAPSKDNIVYSTGKAEETSFADNSFDLVTVAQAYHWFRFDAFEQEVKRVLKRNGIIAVWGYNIPLTKHNLLNTAIIHFYKDIVGSFWDPERKYVDEAYQTVPFNFNEILPAQTFSIRMVWSKENLLGYFNSWSSVQHFIKAKQYNPVNEMATQLSTVWPPEPAIEFLFPVFTRVGRISK